jgi:hypothetical protein
MAANPTAGRQTGQAHCTHLSWLHAYLPQAHEKSQQYANEARALVKEDDFYNLACLDSILDNQDEAFRNLAKAVKQNPSIKEWARLDPDLQWIRQDPRFDEILGK